MTKIEPLWEDKDIRFDLNREQFSLRDGEKLVQNHSEVEDTKGNPGKRGTLFVTNLRVMWQCDGSPKINLSIGHSTINNLFKRKTTSKIMGTCESVCLATKSNNNRFEFIFTDEKKQTSAIFSVISAITKAYESSRLYRDLKLRGALIHSGQLRLLPTEEIHDKVNGVWNLSSEQGNLGTFFITNVRVVWFANMNESYNVSLPYQQISNIKVRDSKFGFALVIESSWQSGGFVLGFRIDPVERIRKVAKQISAQHGIFVSKPSYGVQIAVDESDSDASGDDERKRSPGLVRSQSSVITEDVEIDHTMKSDAFVAYFADGQLCDNNASRQVTPVYSKELGLAIEPLRSGCSIESLWKLF